MFHNTIRLVGSSSASHTSNTHVPVTLESAELGLVSVVSIVIYNFIIILIPITLALLFFSLSLKTFKWKNERTNVFHLRCDVKRTTFFIKNFTVILVS
jgi:hypothetical protein